MAGEWLQTQLGEVAIIASGKRPPLVSKNPTPTCQVPVVGGGGPSGFTDKALYDGRILITGRVGTLGKLFAPSGPCWPSDNALVIQPRSSQTDAIFLRYALQLVIPEAVGMNRGAANPLITQGDLGRLTIAYPPLPEQRAIAHILGTLDDKIELNRRMSETLEAIARALFESWFVRFEPVRRNMARKGRGQPSPAASRHPLLVGEGRSEGVAGSEAFDHLFPDSFQDSELGEIPEGWGVGTVQDLGVVICGKTPPTADKDNYGNDVPFVTIPDMHSKVFVTRTEKKLSIKGADSQKNKFLPPFSICVSCIATPGLVALTCTQCQTNQQINSVIPSNPQASLFCYFSLRGLGDRIRTHGAGGSVLLNLNKGQFSSLKLILPSDDEAESFQKVALPILKRILNNENECETLAALRDALLPKLISGEIRVKDAERFLKERAL